MKTFFPNILMLLPLLILLGCPSTPETSPEATPTPTPDITGDTQSGTPTATPGVTPAVSPVTDQEILEVQNAIARAEEVGASEYAGMELSEARSSLELARETRDSDPAGARSRLQQGKKAADIAFEKAAQETAAGYARRLRLTNEKLLEIEAEKFTSSRYETLAADVAEVEALVDAEKYVEAMALADDTLGAMLNLHAELSDRLSQISSLKKDTDSNLREAEKYEAYLWTPEKLEQIDTYYFLGVSALEEYKLEDAEEYFGFAKELSLDMLVSAMKIKKMKEAEALQKEVLGMLEETSRLNVVTEDGRIIEADPIDMEEFLKSIEEEQEKEETGEPISMLNMVPGEVVVLADVESDSLLNQAKEFVRRGIIAERNGQLDEAMDYYIQAKNYLRLHKAQSVSQVYTVRLIPSRRDCLWRIAEYDFVYGNPYLWPLIWRRNRKQIQNPNLIEPGWQLIIPEK